MRNKFEIEENLEMHMHILGDGVQVPTSIRSWKGFWTRKAHELLCRNIYLSNIIQRSLPVLFNYCLFPFDSNTSCGSQQESRARLHDIFFNYLHKICLCYCSLSSLSAQSMSDLATRKEAEALAGCEEASRASNARPRLRHWSAADYEKPKPGIYQLQ